MVNEPSPASYKEGQKRERERERERDQGTGKGKYGTVGRSIVSLAKFSVHMAVYVMNYK